MGSRPRERLHDRPTPTLHPTTPTLLNALDDPKLFQPFFSDAESWKAWRAFIAAAFGLPMSADELAIYRQCTGRIDPPTAVAREAWLVVGRRGGKSRILALIAVWLATAFDYRPFLAAGERGTVQVIASDRKQARTIVRYVKAFLSGVPMLARMIEGETQEGVTLSNSVAIEVATASFRSVRGFTLVAALLDELAFWQDESSANPDTEILAAIRPGMATIANAMLLCASSPYARKGALHDAHKRHFGKEGDAVLVWQADTKTMNPAIDPRVIEAAYEADPASAAAEYGAQFRNDIESFIAREAIEACVSAGIRERPALGGIKYSAFLDPAGGSGKDSFTCAIAHKADGVAILDCLREFKPPFSPEAVVSELAKLLGSYRIKNVIGDRFAGEWVRQPFKLRGITYEPSARPKSEIFRDALPIINSRRCDLLDHSKMLGQFAALERRTARNGKDSIDHPPNAHDDLANVVAGVLTNLSTRRYAYRSDMSWVRGVGDEREEYRRQRLAGFLLNGGFV